MRLAGFLGHTLGVVSGLTTFVDAFNFQSDLGHLDNDNSFYNPTFANLYSEALNNEEEIFDSYPQPQRIHNVPPNHIDFLYKTPLIPRAKSSGSRSTSPSNPQYIGTHSPQPHKGTTTPPDKANTEPEPYQWTPAGAEESLEIEVVFPPEWLNEGANSDAAATSDKGSPRKSHSPSKNPSVANPHRKLSWRDAELPIVIYEPSPEYARAGHAIRHSRRSLSVNPQIHVRAPTIRFPLGRSSITPNIRMAVSHNIQHTRQITVRALESSTYKYHHLKDPARMLYVYSKDKKWWFYQKDKLPADQKWPSKKIESKSQADHKTELQEAYGAFLFLQFNILAWEKEGKSVNAPNFVKLLGEEIIPRHVKKIPPKLDAFIKELNHVDNLQSIPSDVNGLKEKITTRARLELYDSFEKEAGGEVKVKRKYQNKPPEWTKDRCEALLEFRMRKEVQENHLDKRKALVKAVGNIIKFLDPGSEHKMLAEAYGQNLEKIDQEIDCILRLVTEHWQQTLVSSTETNDGRSFVGGK